MIPIKIITTGEGFRIESIDDTITIHDVTGPLYADIISIGEIIDAEKVDDYLLYKSDELVNKLRKESGTENSVFYLMVCNQPMFIVETQCDVKLKKMSD
jgi:hypothetical protein